MSDLHIGSSNFDKELFHKHAYQALKENARILINGDIFDAITITDPRFGLESLDRQLRNCSDILGKSLEYAENVLKKYAKNIDLLGSGNHEQKINEKYNLDMTRMLTLNLRRINDKIQYGGYSGVICYKFNNGSELNIMYHHGWGAAVKTRGLSHFDHLSSSFENIDVFWLGHLHTQSILPFKKVKIIDGQLLEKNGFFVRSGSYYTNIAPNRDPLEQGTRLNYGLVSGFHFSISGCVRLEVLSINKNLIKIVPSLLTK